MMFKKSTPPPRKSTRGFTIVEILVTTSIITLLIGLLLPALASMKTTARQTQCQSNLRQMTFAAQQYAALWDSYPTALRYQSVERSAQTVAWDWVTQFSTGERIAPGAIWSFTDHPDRVMQCPGYVAPNDAENTAFTGYNYNTDYIGGEAITTQFGWDIVRRGIKPSACRRVSETAIFGIGGYSNGPNKFMRSPENPHRQSLQITYAGGQAFPYHGSTNIAYIDGHVGTADAPMKGNRATENLLKLLGYPRNGFLSDDDRAYNPR